MPVRWREFYALRALAITNEGLSMTINRHPSVSCPDTKTGPLHSKTRAIARLVLLCLMPALPEI